MRRHLKALVGIAAIPVIAATVLLAARPAAAASLTQVTNFGANPSNLNMYIYVPDNVAAKPAILVAVHYCTGSASAVFSGYARDYVTAADQYGYIIVFPEATRSGQCFDVYSPQALTRGGGSDPVGIMSMVSYAQQRYNGDSDRIYVTGFSSGAMMTNVLAAQYPDVFAAGSAFMGVPAGCFATTDGSTWNSQCSGGQIIKSAQEWGDLARSMYPGYGGAYPRMQLWHGTADTTLSYPNFAEEIKQWTNLNGVSQTPVLTDHPQSTWTRTRYGGSGTTAPVEGVSVEGVGHALPQSGMVGYAIAFLDLASSGPTSSPSSSTPSSSPSSQSPSPSTSPSGSVAPGACQVAYTTNAWSTGLTANVTITNTSTTAVNGWSMTFTLPSGQTIVSGWNATYAPASGEVTATNLSYNATIAPNASIGIGFQATHTGDTAVPTGFALNGTACGVA
ncbi:MAG: PHB depolymerase family esterase [Dactylosporangium sp.]|nr:PHB depolymerase family esterase [Dactylosporangium sp.]NNJ61296.1 PHB depolymerase family esterase [Dactylosporangium sp.]